MSVRVGESWRTANGRRRWVSMPLSDLLLGWGVLAVVIGPFWLLWRLLLLEAWLVAEVCLLAVSVVLVAADLAAGRRGRVTVAWVGLGLFTVTLEIKQGEAR